MAALSAPLVVRGTVRVPGDKSISHRALILSAIAEGTSRVRGLLDSADVRSTEGALRVLGVGIARNGDDVQVTGCGQALHGATFALDCGNSGTTARLLAGVVAGSRADATFTGDASLSRRPMRRVAAPLEAMGARVRVAPHGGLPMRIRGGALRDLQWRSEVASAQVKGAALLAGCMSGARVDWDEPQRSRDHSERMLAARGATITCNGTRVSLDAGTRLHALDVDVPGDPSSAAFLVGLAAIADAGELVLEDVCLNPTRTGAFEVLRRMGADITFERMREQGGEPVGDIRVRPAPLRGTTISAAEVPSLVDEIPLLACVAACAEGDTVVMGAAELRVKESDRIATVVEALRSSGADAHERPDGLHVRGPAGPLRGRVVTHGDHRIAMAFGVLGALARSDLVVDDAACVDVSYPQFWRDVANVRK